jgi:Domain of unknown function (DUF6430)
MVHLLSRIRGFVIRRRAHGSDRRAPASAIAEPRQVRRQLASAADTQREWWSMRSLRDVRHWVGDRFRHEVLSHMFGLLGVVAAVAGLGQIFVPAWTSRLQAWQGGAGLAACWAAALWRCRRRGAVAWTNPSGPWSIELRRASLFEFGPIVVTCDRLFNQSLSVVGAKSLVGQLQLTRPNLTSDAGSLLPTSPAEVGTVQILRDAEGPVFLLAVGDPLGLDAVSWEQLNRAYSGLWKSIGSMNLSEIYCPLIGGGYSATLLSQSALLIALISSFHGASLSRPVCPHLTIVVPSTTIGSRNFDSIDQFMEQLGYERSAVERGAPNWGTVLKTPSTR